MVKDLKFRGILMLSADSPERFRSCDVDRVMDAANEAHVLEGFRTWLLSQAITKQTRELVAEWSA